MNEIDPKSYLSLNLGNELETKKFETAEELGTWLNGILVEWHWLSLVDNDLARTAWGKITNNIHNV